MDRPLRVALYSSLAIGLAAVVMAFSLAVLLTTHSRKPDPAYLDKTVQLSNSALLRVHAITPFGASDSTWELLYREKSGWEKVDDWMAEGQISLYSGDVLACPVGSLVVVTRTDGSQVFVRNAGGKWTTFHMEIPERAPFPLMGANGTNVAASGPAKATFTTLETEKIQALRTRMAISPAQMGVPSRLGQFFPDKRELWVDYLTPSDRRFRLRLGLTADGERFGFVGFEELPFKRASDTTGAPLFLLLPDMPTPTACSRVQMLP
jgi:hypothetical protein